MTNRSIDVLGVRVTPYTIHQLNGLIKKCIDNNERRIIAHQNLHGVYYHYRDEELRAFYLGAYHVHVDSMPMILLARFMGYPVQRAQRVTFVDWTMPLFHEASSCGWRVFYLGSRPGVALQGRRILEKKFRNLDLIVRHGYFNDTPGHRENERVIQEINRFRPRILMVGMGMPKQERWIMRNFSRLHANVVISCGACMDYIAGVTPTPPRWLGRIGLEWLCRLVYEPRRLWKRNLYEPVFLLRPLIKDVHVGFSRRKPWKQGHRSGKSEKGTASSPETRYSSTGDL
jgi:N-acetylglucosaminyldiphosphoundecaprenol N-acetyl-beta-D-mannosaminyltransferase